ncbi:hypothetical protein SDC9_192019 [bioreactor metagenome]|uniref:Uncharacterized protein n=1 Tax=bioreactor metagenome TaxID=1076179 RepID=A0A645I812_9ZZZZ
MSRLNGRAGLLGRLGRVEKEFATFHVDGQQGGQEALSSVIEVGADQVAMFGQLAKVVVNFLRLIQRVLGVLVEPVDFEGVWRLFAKA